VSEEDDETDSEAEPDSDSEDAPADKRLKKGGKYIGHQRLSSKMF